MRGAGWADRVQATSPPSPRAQCSSTVGPDLSSPVPMPWEETPGASLGEPQRSGAVGLAWALQGSSGHGCQSPARASHGHGLRLLWWTQGRGLLRPRAL